ncbi:MAG: hypothetical protein L0312_26645 [Acidobacteria bacterium]|nr:hypothetical protein [Acidobacteriota bacterium]
MGTRGKILPTNPRIRWEVIEAVPASRSRLKDLLNAYSENGWTHYAFLRSSQIGKWDVVFYKLEQVGKKDEVDELMEANLPPFQGAQRVND